MGDSKYDTHHECETHCNLNGVCTEGGHICFDNFETGIGYPYLEFNLENHDVANSVVIKSDGAYDFDIIDVAGLVSDGYGWGISFPSTYITP